MVSWEGTIVAGELSIEAKVHSVEEENGFKNWYGTGRSSTLWPLGTMDTNVGRIIINKSSGNNVEFTGTGVPQGRLAEALGI